MPRLQERCSDQGIDLGAVLECGRNGHAYATVASRLVLSQADQPTLETVQTCQNLGLFWFAVGQLNKTDIHTRKCLFRGTRPKLMAQISHTGYQDSLLSTRLRPASRAGMMLEPRFGEDAFGLAGSRIALVKTMQTCELGLSRMVLI